MIGNFLQKASLYTWPLTYRTHFKMFAGTQLVIWSIKQITDLTTIKIMLLHLRYLTNNVILGNWLDPRYLRYKMSKKIDKYWQGGKAYI